MVEEEEEEEEEEQNQGEGEKQEEEFEENIRSTALISSGNQDNREAEGHIFRFLSL